MIEMKISALDKMTAENVLRFVVEEIKNIFKAVYANDIFRQCACV